MGMALGTTQSAQEAELLDLYEIVDGQKVWPRVGEPDGESLYEIVDGVKQEVPPMSALATTIASFLVTHLNLFAWTHKLGFAVTETMFQLSTSRPQRRPDLAFISYARWSPLSAAAQEANAWTIVPNLATEVISPNNTIEEIDGKLQDYFATGVELVWVIFPRQRRIYVYESPTQIRILTENDELDGGPVLPGFRLRVAELFGPLVMPA